LYLQELPKKAGNHFATILLAFAFGEENQAKTADSD
jgi:hypothetical protein